ncbi:protein CNGC15b [Selaginella moellendorffii]|uniref:protein CNGC15b n=1 Tax=Selaginella moellendorffii TaxID=88036 RepID=UPI000D1C8B11|nr:protein CNGC15b [Selaginella moellendorffii]|eukprot:XP_024541742.1 protein CNGC15b [Selaginella moellendorffii]
MREFGRVKTQKMEGRVKKFVRFESDYLDFDAEVPHTFAFETIKPGSGDVHGIKHGSRWFSGLGSLQRFGRSLNFGARVFSEDHELSETRIFDPRSRFIQQWNNFFILSCLLAAFIDPLFFYLPVINQTRNCSQLRNSLKVVVTVLRTIIDCSYLFHMLLRFRTAFIAPSSRVFGRGELVVDSWQIAKRYLFKDFVMDILSVLPLPQILIWGNSHLTANKTMNTLRYIVLVQYFPRLLRIIPLTTQKQSTTGILLETAWAGAAFNLLLYILASHVLGAWWYLLSTQAQDRCWRRNCSNSCNSDFFDCGVDIDNSARTEWLNAVQASCSTNSTFSYGIYKDALDNGIISTGLDFVNQYFYCLWWGLRNLSSLGQGLATSNYVEETLFAILIGILGLIFFAFLIGNMQTYLASITVRLEEMRLKRRDSEQWMRHRQLPPVLRDRVRRYDQYKWVTTRGVDEEMLVQTLPLDLRRDIKRHLCLDLVRQVPMFDKMDERLLEAICERLQPVLHTEGNYIVREGDPVNEMLFIIRGRLESVTTNGGRTGFYNVQELGPGAFCGEELLTWALHPKPSKNLPSSTRTVRALVEVEAFSLKAEDLKFVAGQFRRLHSKQLQHTFRYYSQQWRTWAVLYIQAAWRRFQRRKEHERRETVDQSLQEAAIDAIAGTRTSGTSIGAALLASRFAANALRGVHRMRLARAAELTVKLSKPAEPDFSAPEEDE